MTWLADVQKDRPDDAKRAKLLAQRDKLVKEIELLKASPLGGKSAAAARFRVEDLTALAKKVTNIDKTLGRTE